jgi:hypothetical protein
MSFTLSNLPRKFYHKPKPAIYFFSVEERGLISKDYTSLLNLYSLPIIPLFFEKMHPLVGGYYSWDRSKSISINREIRFTNKAISIVVLHEIRHYIQDKQGVLDLNDAYDDNEADAINWSREEYRRIYDDERRREDNQRSRRFECLFKRDPS